MFRFINCYHKRRDKIKLKDHHKQPPNYVVDAYLYTIKADILRFIYECLSGENGLFSDINEKIDFNKLIRLYGKYNDTLPIYTKSKETG